MKYNMGVSLLAIKPIFLTFDIYRVDNDCNFEKINYFTVEKNEIMATQKNRYWPVSLFENIAKNHCKELANVTFYNEPSFIDIDENGYYISFSGES